MDILLLFVFAVIGMTNILVDSVFFLPLRNWISIHVRDLTSNPIPNPKYKLLNIVYNLNQFFMPKIQKIFACYQCMGTWCGFFCGAILISFNPFVILMCGCAGSFLAVFAGIIFNYLEANTIVDLEK